MKLPNELPLGVLLLCAGVAIYLSGAPAQAQTTGQQTQLPAGHSHHTMPATISNSFASPHIITDFDLLTADDSSVSVDDFVGSFLLLGFGFTNCDYVCPTMSANIASVIGKTDLAVQGAIISVDTERDTPSLTHAYAQRFHPRLMGLSGSHAQVAAAAKNFGVSFVVTKTQKSFTVQHTASLFLIDPQGDLIDVFALNASPANIVETIRSWKPS